MMRVQDFIAVRFGPAAAERRRAHSDRLPRLTALRATPGGDFYRSNTPRGKRLCHRVQHLRPATSAVLRARGTVGGLPRGAGLRRRADAHV